MPYYYIWTIGCQMNRAESERLEALLQKQGYQPAAALKEADLIILNSCVVRQHAENRVVDKIANLKPLKKRASGIEAGADGMPGGFGFSSAEKEIPPRGLLLQTGRIPPLAGKKKMEWCCPAQPSVSSFVTIMQGCNNFCSYCIVPYRPRA